jgi:hypothetical protein
VSVLTAPHWICLSVFGNERALFFCWDNNVTFYKLLSHFYYLEFYNVFTWVFTLVLKPYREGLKVQA